jgi:hypothetical protein
MSKALSPELSFRVILPLVLLLVKAIPKRGHETGARASTVRTADLIVNFSEKGGFPEN